MKSMRRALVYTLILNSICLHSGFVGAAPPIPGRKPLNLFQEFKVAKSSPSDRPPAKLVEIDKSAAEVIQKYATAEEEYTREYDQSRTSNSMSKFLKVVDVYQRAFEIDPQLKASNHELAAALHLSEAEKRKAYSPKLSLSGSLTYGDFTTTKPGSLGNSQSAATTAGWTSQWALNLTQPIFNYDQILKSDQAEFAINISRVKNAGAQQNLMIRVAKAYLEVLKAEESLWIKESEIKATEVYVEILRRQFDIGFLKKPDLDNAEAQLDSIKSDRLDLFYDLDVARGVFVQNWDINPDYINRKLKDKITFLPPKPNDVNTWTSEARKSNLDVLYNNLLTESVSFDMAREKAALYVPLINGVLSYSQVDSSQRLMGASTSLSDGYTVGVQVVLPLSDGGEARERTKRQAELKLQSQANTLNAQNSSAQASLSAFRGVKTSIEKVRKYQSSVERSQESYKGIVEDYNMGGRLNIEVLTALKTLNGYKKDLINEKFNYIVNRLALKQSVGSLTIEDLAEVDSYLQSRSKN